MNPPWTTGCIVAVLALAPISPASAQRAEPPRTSGWLVLDRVDERGRRPFRPDAVFAHHVLGLERAPVVRGATLSGEVGSAAWESGDVDEDGRVEGRPAYAWTTCQVATDGVWLADLTGASTLFVNGAGFVGNVYGYDGWKGVPVALQAGANDVFVTGTRGSFRLRWHAPPAELFSAAWDATLPDLVERERFVGEGAVLVVNASTTARRELAIVVEGDEPLARVETRVRVDLPALGLTKVPIPVVAGPADAGELTLRVTVRDPEREHALHASEHRVAVRPGGAARRVTFRSGIDASVQSFALLEPAPGPADVEPGLMLSLHGAGVDALGQVRSYAAKPDWWIVAPTNRRPFGFDWQDWGRRDAYEVLRLALGRSGVARERVALTGHSMGGHGTWHLAANDADGFAAIGPSAGWRSFDTYAGGRPAGELRELWHAADAASATEGLLANLARLPIYVLHGADDRTVPVAEARALEAALDELGADVASHYEDGAGHWWDAEGPGVACVDWPPMVARFRRARIPREPDRLAFRSVDPSVDADHHWVRVDQPRQYGRAFAVTAERDTAHRAVSLTTDNVRRASVDLAPGRWTVVLDGTALDVEASAHEPVRFLRADGAWRTSEGTPDTEKHPGASGPFKRLFDRAFVFVVGSGGTPEAARVRLERARYDAATWWYRGNGRVAVVFDHEYAAARQAYADRNVVLYGNADACSVWRELIAVDGPIDVSADGVRLGERELTGDTLGAVFVVRAAASAGAPASRLVGAFADTGARAARCGYLLAPFVSGVGYPDYAVFDASVATGGDGGVRAAGWFGPRWNVDPRQRTFERER